MLNQEQLAAIAAAMSILQQQQQQQQALINQYQAELQQIQNYHPNQQNNLPDNPGINTISSKLGNGTSIPTITSARQHPFVADSVPPMRLSHLQHQLSPQLAPKIVEQPTPQSSLNQPTSMVTPVIVTSPPKQTRPPTSYSAIVAKSTGRVTNLLGFMGLYVGNLSPNLTKEQLEKIFSKYGDSVKVHRLIRSPVAFIKYDNTESPRAAIDDLYGVLLPELTLNQNQALKLHFDRNDAQLRAAYRPTELPKEDNGECYDWRTTICKRGKSCPKKHIPINRGIDFQMWMIRSDPSSSATTDTFGPTE